MWRNFFLSLLGLALIGIAAPAGADNTMGQCNRTMAMAVGTAQQIVQGIGDQAEQCDVALVTLLAYAGAGCMQLLADGELGGLIVATNAPVPDDGILSPLGNTICTALITCGLGPLLPETVCPDFH